MHIPKHYFHDRAVLLLIGINVFLMFAVAVTVLLRLDTANTTGHIVEYRSQLGLSEFRSGTASALLSFIPFAAIVTIFHTVLSMRVYHIKRHFSVAVLGMGLLLLVLSFLASNALLVLQ